MIGLRDGAGVAVAAASVPLAVVTAGATGYVAAVPGSLSACAAGAVVVSWPRARSRIAWPAALVAVVSLGATAVTALVRYGDSVSAGLFGMVEVAGLLVLLALVARWAPLRSALVVAGAAGLAATVWILRFLPETAPLNVLLACALWAIGPAAAALGGGYPRLAAMRLARSVTAARLAQRRELAHDLHDFVAHEVTGMVVQAQAARYAAATDPARLLAALERIETVGLRALSALDRMVATLRTDEGEEPQARGATAPPAVRLGLRDIAEVVAGYRAAHPGTALQFAIALPEPLDDVPAPVGTTAYRVVVESLTNVRRHAPDAATVQVSLCLLGSETLRVEVVNDLDRTAAPLPRTGTAGGSGLAVLRERVVALGGSLVATRRDGSWVVQADLPLNGRSRPEAGPGAEAGPGTRAGAGGSDG